MNLHAGDRRVSWSPLSSVAEQAQSFSRDGAIENLAENWKSDIVVVSGLRGSCEEARTKLLPWKDPMSRH